jgi:hypothetical protein
MQSIISASSHAAVVEKAGRGLDPRRQHRQALADNLPIPQSAAECLALADLCKC